MEENSILKNLSLYQLFYLICQNGSFSKTADILGITQPTISYNIKKLENELGINLFTRGNILTLTPEGEELLPYVEEAINSIKNGEKKINELINLQKGQISIGIPSHIGVFLLTNLMKFYNKEYPNIKIKVECKPTKELFRLLYLNKIDLVIDCSPLEENIHNFIIKKISKEKCSFACHYKRTELLNRIVKLSELSNYPIIVPLKTSSNTKELMSIFKKKNIVFDPLYEISTSDMIAEMVENEMGIGYLFDKTIEKYPNIRKINNDCKLPEFDIFLIYKENLLSITTKSFIKFVLETMV